MPQFPREIEDRIDDYIALKATLEAGRMELQLAATGDGLSAPPLESPLR